MTLWFCHCTLVLLYNQVVSADVAAASVIAYYSLVTVVLPILRKMMMMKDTKPATGDGQVELATKEDVEPQPLHLAVAADIPGGLAKARAQMIEEGTVFFHVADHGIRALMTQDTHYGAVVGPVQDRGNVGFDLYNEGGASIKFPLGTRRTLNTGVTFRFPPNYFGLIVGKSRLNRDGWTVQCGVVDESYRGPVGVTIDNTTAYTGVLKEKEPIAQIVALPRTYMPRFAVDNVEDLDDITDLLWKDKPAFQERGASAFGTLVPMALRKDFDFTGVPGSKPAFTTDDSQLL